MKNPRLNGLPFNSYGRGPHLLLVLLLAVTTLVVPGRAFAETPPSEASSVEFNIPAQSVPAALSEFARQAQVQLFFISGGFEDIQANSVVGTYATQEALDLLLAGTGLAATVSSGTGVKVKEVPVSMQPLTLHSQLFAGAAVDVANAEYVFEQDDSQDTRTRGNRGSGDSNEEGDSGTDIDEIIVTGSNISGVEVVGADVITLDRAYIEMSGIATTTELIQSVPQNFGIGNEAVVAVGAIQNAGRNRGFSSSVNLRGLGTDSTLILLNGRRVASGGSSGNFVDLNIIPVAAIERIDVLPDGASAIYGSDAVGGVVNVILRDDYEGAETRVRYAPGTSNIDEIQFSQMFGKKWDTGNVLFAYEYYDRSELKSADRAYTRDSDLRPLGGGNHNIEFSNPGNITNFLNTFAIPAAQDGTDLTPSDLVDVSENPDALNLQNIREGSYVLPKQRRHSVFTAVTQALSADVELFAEARYSTRRFEYLNQQFPGSFLRVPSSNAFFVDPFDDGFCAAVFGVTEDCVLVNYSFVDDYGPTRSSGDVEAVGAVLGATIGLGDSWELELYGSHGTEDTYSHVDQFANRALLAVALADSNPATAFNPFGDGSFTNQATLTAIEGFTDVNIESKLSTFDIRLEGNLFELPGGAAKLAVGGQFRDQSLSSNTTEFVNTTEPVPGFAGEIYDLNRDVTAAFAEIYLPLVTDQNSRPGLKSLMVSIAGRYEDYNDFGDTFNPKLGLSWSPVESLNIRGTVGTSFRAPLLTEMNTANNSITLRNRADPASPTGSTLVLQLAGNSPNLVPQEGTNWTAGIDVTPDSLPGLKVGITYFSTDLDNVIQVPLTVFSTILLDPITNAPIITRCPCDIETVTALLNDPRFLDIGIPIPAPEEVGAITDSRVQNIAKTELTGLDFDVAYAFETTAGVFNLSFYASHLFEFQEQLSNGPLVDNVDTLGNPNSIKLRGSLFWHAGSMNAVVTAKHIGDYTDDLGSVACNLNPCAVSSWTTWDVQLGYDFGDQTRGYLDGVKLSVSAQNVFDQDPPFVDVSDAGVGFDAINANPMGRFVALQLTKTW